ncbi:phosphohydrolase [Candidatus Pacearchaeota archaeon CG10_big_fil_rev_8_21_14_0_10_32_42]|nr:MAG: phosphohydrolase [Candidatus Pacearchaeota archaeon CG10_big_fil_rev_8_21_14_0_10_32_42]
MINRKGDWIQVFSGKKFWPFDPKNEEIDINDIAHALALQCRFNGHCEEFYSIAQHSVLVSKIVPKDQALSALLHDAAEAYIGDMVRPLKKFMEEFKSVEKKVEKEIFKKFEVAGLNEEIKKADNIALATEMRDLMKRSPENWDISSFGTLPEKIIPLNPKEAKEEFLKRFYELIKTRNLLNH